MNINTIPYQKLAAVFAKDANLSVVIGGKEFDEGKSVGHTSLKAIHMPPIPDTDDGVTMWFGVFLHECLHHEGNNHDDFALIKKYKIDIDSTFGWLLNAVVDHNIERKCLGELIGRDKFLADSAGMLYAKHKPVSIDPEDKVNSAIQAMFVFDNRMRATWMNHGVSIKIQPHVEKYITKLMPFAQEYLTPRDGGEENYDLALRMFEALGLEQDDPEEEENKGEGEGEGEEGGGDAPSGGKPDPKMSPAQHGKGSDTINDDLEGNMPSGSDKIPSSKGGAYKQQDESVSHPKGDPVSIPSSPLAHKVSTLLRVASAVKTQGGFKRGKVHNKALCRIPAGSTTPFKQKTNKDVLNTAVVLLVDCSGSMYGSKWETAKAAAAQLSSCLQGIHIPHAVLGFTCDSNKTGEVNHYIFKDFNSNESPSQILGNMNAANLTNNADGQAVLWAYDKIAQQKQKRKLMIVLSDGQPSCRRGEGMDQHLKKTCGDIEKKGQVELYGVGILTEAPKKFYKNYVTLDSLANVESTVFNLIKKTIGV